MKDFKGVNMNNQRNKDGTFKSKKAKKTVEASFLTRLLSLPNKEEKQALIAKHNPYFFVLFNGGDHVSSIQSQ